MAHLQHTTLRLLRNMVNGFPELSIKHHDVCRGCDLGKYYKNAFPNSDMREPSILDLVHSNLCGPMSLASLIGFEYYFVFVDDISRKTWIYFKKRKESK